MLEYICSYPLARKTCEKLLELAGRNAKKRGNKKSGESITPIRYNVIHSTFCKNMLDMLDV